MTSNRLWATFLCLIMLFSISSACAEEEEIFVPFTRSETALTDSGAVVTGTRAQVDFDYLRQLNPDAVAWLYQEDTGFSRPIMQGTDNEYYRNHTFDGARLNGKGSVYLDAASPADLSGNAVYLYGMGRQNCPFRLFNSYTKQAWYSNHASLRLITPEGDWHAEVFAAIDSTWKDESSWRVPEEDEAFEIWLEKVLDKNHILPLTGSVPSFGDRILALVINNKNPSRTVVLAKLTPIRYETQDTINLIKHELASRETISGRKQVWDLGQFMVYAQNDPIWNRMQYESERNPVYRVFGDGGCGPTAAAIAIANLVDVSELPKIQQHSLNGIGTLMCPCSVNRVYCDHTHVPYLISSPEEYLRYLPVVMGDFAAGNNDQQVISRRVGSTGSNMNFLNVLCEIFGINRIEVADFNDGVEQMRGHTGDRMMICYALFNSAYTNTSHYVVVVGVDEEYFYVLDPLFRDSYATTDERDLLEVMDYGVTRIRLDQSHYADLSPVYILEKGA